MDIRIYVKSIISLLFLVTVSGCYFLAPPPSHVQASVVISNQNIPHFYYWPCIANERELRGLSYYFSGVEIREANCPGSHCDHLVWEIRSDAVWSKTQPDDRLVPLPKSIQYGENIPKMRVTIPAETLKLNVKYSVVIGIMGLDENYKSKHLSADVDFSLNEDSKGHLKVFQEGACPIE